MVILVHSLRAQNEDEIKKDPINRSQSRKKQRQLFKQRRPRLCLPFVVQKQPTFDESRHQL